MILSKELIQHVKYQCPKLFSTLYIQNYTAIQYRWTTKQDDCYCWKWYIQPSAKVPHMSVHPDRAMPEEDSEGLASRQHWNKKTANCHQLLYTGIQAKAVYCCNIIICWEVTACSVDVFISLLTLHVYVSRFWRQWSTYTTRGTCTETWSLQISFSHLRMTV